MPSETIGDLPWQSIHPLLIALFIFLLRGLNLTLSTVSTLLVVRGFRLATWMLTFCQSILFITVIQGVLKNMDSLLNVVAYAGGYATGILAGILLESRISPGHSMLRIVSCSRGEAIFNALHQNGFGATIISGRGKDGMVASILCFLRRRDIKQVHTTVLEIDEDAFIVSENVRQLLGGWHT
ncbi:MAG: DUF2179 domain-containing protein [Anaerolineales bacterium]|nr:DUF2179 domain-containing protein [Anaerolineales bacterium]